MSKRSNLPRRVALIAALGVAVAMAIPGAVEAQENLARRPLVLVVGGTGRTGENAVRLLKPNYRVRVLTRSPDRAREQLGADVELVAGELADKASLTKAVEGVRYVIVATGAGSNRAAYDPEQVDFRGTRNVVEAALAAGTVDHFVLISSMGVTQLDHPLNRNSGNVLLWKALGENSLRFSKLNYTVVRPGGLGDGPDGTMALRVGQGDKFREWASPRSELPFVRRADVAAVAVAALGRPELYSRTFELWSDPASTPVEWNTLFAGLVPDRVFQLSSRSQPQPAAPGQLAPQGQAQPSAQPK